MGFTAPHIGALPLGGPLTCLWPLSALLGAADKTLDYFHFTPGACHKEADTY